MTENYITKVKNQFKSSTYYVFWGTATFVVVAGQIYVGTGYHQTSKSLDAWFDKTISIMIQKRLMQQPPRGIDPYIYGEPDRMPIIR